MDKTAQKKRTCYYGFDIVKIFMAVGVVAVHTSAQYGCWNPWYIGPFEYFFRLSVPFFFMVSSFLLFQKFDGDFSSQENKRILNAYLLRITKMYLLWQLFHLPPAIYAANLMQQSLPAALKTIAIGLLCRGELFMSWHLWYLLGTIYFLVLASAAMKLKVRENTLLVVCIAVFLLSFVMTDLANNRESLTGPAGKVAEWIYTYFQNGRVFTGIGYMAMGMWMARHKARPSMLLSVLVLAGGVLFEIWLTARGQTSMASLLVSAYAISLFVIAERFRGTANWPVFRLCRNFSTVIYLVHMLWYYLVSRLAWGVYTEASYGVGPFLVVLALCVATAALVEPLRKWKIVRFLFS